MTAAFESLVAHLQENKLVGHPEPSMSRVRANFAGRNGAYPVVMQVDEHLLQIFAHPGFAIPAGARATVAEVVARANYGLKLDKFEFHPDVGELHFQSATPLHEDGTVPQRGLLLCISSVVISLDRYVPALLSVIYGNETAADAVRLAEAA